MTLQDSFSAYVREAMHRRLRHILAWRVTAAANDNHRPLGAA